MDESTRRYMAAWTGCLAGALIREEYVAGLEEAGFSGITVTETHRVHEHAGKAITCARKPTNRRSS